MMVVLNKVDMMDEPKDEKLTTFSSKLKESFKRTKFGESVEVVPISACPREGEPQGIDELLYTLLNDIEMPERGDDHRKEDLLYSVDHCFAIKGKGTVLTGTVLKGKISCGDEVEITQLGQTKKVKSIQMF